MARRIVSIWFPHLAAERVIRKDGRDPLRPFVLYGTRRNALRLCSLNRSAEAAGLSVGMTLTDARAILPGLETQAEAPVAEAAFRKILIRWARRYSPWVAAEGEEGLVLDITGCAHLFGGEEALCRDLSARLARAGLTAFWGVAETRGGAWALARYAPGRIAATGAVREALFPLPAAALRLTTETLSGLASLGLRRVADVATLPRAALARRFGMEAVRRRDQAFGQEPEPVAPAALDPVYAARLSLPEPIGRVEDVMAGLDRLLEHVTEKLRIDQKGARRLRLSIERSDHGREDAEIGLGRPMLDKTRIAALFAPHVAEMDAGFGIDRLRLEAIATEPMPPEQISAAEERRIEDNRLTDLIARLGNRLGFERVQRFHRAESHLPERAYIRAAAAYSEAETLRPEPQMRPIAIFAPERILEEAPGAPPARFRWRCRAFEIVDAAGPERIAPEWWWDDPAARHGLRDYWRIATNQGPRLWLFRAHGAESAAGWFVQGEFP